MQQWWGGAGWSLEDKLCVLPSEEVTSQLEDPRELDIELFILLKLGFALFIL